MNTTLAQAFPAIAAQIDAERVLLTRPIAEHTTCEWSDKEILLHCEDDSTYQLLTTPSQSSYLRTAFALPIHAMRKLPAPAPAKDPSDPSPSSDLPTPEPRKRTANALNFLERDALRHWMLEPESTHLVAHGSDTEAATQASIALENAFTGLVITPGNVASMRKLLGIEKIKPEKPQPAQLPDGLTLADLQKQLHTLQTNQSIAEAAQQANQLDQAKRLSDHDSILKDHLELLAARRLHEGGVDIAIDELRVHATGMRATIAELHDRLRVVIDYLGEHSYIAIPPLSPLSSQSSPSGQ